MKLRIYEAIANDRHDLNRSHRREFLSREAAEAWLRQFGAGYQTAIREYCSSRR